VNKPAGFILETVVVGDLQVNCYILAFGPGRLAVIIDPGDDAGKIKKVLAAHKLSPGIVVNTHGHYDHIGADDAFGVPVYAHRDDCPLLKDDTLNFSAMLSVPLIVRSPVVPFEEGQSIASDGIVLRALHIPGHSPGGSALLLESPSSGILFSGDNLFRRSIGRTDFPGGDGELLIKNIREKILTLDPQTVVLPGHGARTTVGEERADNPYLS
jgi:hydroxyacylglutathione hydrolase